ncbi:16445_t:CDS:2 [Racocetra fulgida]|uniref:16445_t:CDS:1 n=1 Tax=Racocetra fulgida TaxID=60492 RepID=A0A9N8VP38_9GLOM|nr:16445_t:CDS:2 [Racocetra fulgida]
MVNQHINKITAELGQHREQAQHNIKKAQGRQKRYYDNKIKVVEFKISDLVLFYDSVKEKY